MIFSAGVPYDVYGSMIDYIQGSELWNPYDHRNVLIKGIATYYSVQKRKGKLGKGNSKSPLRRRILALDTDTRKPFHFYVIEESSFDETAPIWDLSFEELQEAYKTSAMKRHLAWYTEKTLEKTYCLPYFKINKKVGNFPRRITWLYPEEGNSPIYDLYLLIHIT